MWDFKSVITDITRLCECLGPLFLGRKWIVKYLEMPIEGLKSLKKFFRHLTKKSFRRRSLKIQNPFYFFEMEKGVSYLWLLCIYGNIAKLRGLHLEGDLQRSRFYPTVQKEQWEAVLAYCILTAKRGNCSTFTFPCSCLSWTLKSSYTTNRIELGWANGRGLLGKCSLSLNAW